MPGARKSEVIGEHGDALKIKLQAPPVDGKANRALVEFLGEVLGISKSKIRIISGETSRQKRVSIAGCRAATVRGRLLPEGP